jgi:hypothetical protein
MQPFFVADPEEAGNQLNLNLQLIPSAAQMASGFEKPGIFSDEKFEKRGAT